MTNNEMIQTGEKHIMNTYGRYPVALVKGQGPYVWDADGKKYLDFVGGIAVCALGHCPGELVEVLTEQAQTLWHVSNLYWIKPQIELAARLTEATGLDRVFFCNSGAEANEAAIKLVRKYFYRQNKPQKNQIIVMEDSFHGRTMGALSATAQKKHQEGFAPLVPGFKTAKYNDIASVEKLVDEQTCAIIVEPIQGEGGIKPADPEFLAGLKTICDQAGIWLVFDEVQCGMGRTGSFMAYQQYNVMPHIITLAKGLGGGFPIGAMLANEQAAAGFAPGDHASTFGGNPLAAATANKLVEIITDPEFLSAVRENGVWLKERLSKIADPRIKQIRGMGLMLGVEFDTEIGELIGLCRDNGLLLVGAGPKVVRFVPPLNITAAQIEQGAEIFIAALSQWQA